MVALAGLLVTAAQPRAAHAVPDCPGAHPPRTLLTGQPVLESVIVGRDGRLYYTDTDKDAVMVLERPGAAPRMLAGGIASPGGMKFDADGRLIVGYGDALVNGAIGNVAPMAGLMRIDTQTGQSRVFVTGLSMANGVERGPDGTLYASDDAGFGIDRVVAGRVERNWARVASPNGLIADSAGRYLYANQTFVPAAIARVEIANPQRVETFLQAGPTDWYAGLDGLTRDARDRLFAAANGAGEVWRVDQDRSACALVRGLGPPARGPSDVAFGARVGPFAADSLFVVTFAGTILELPRATDAPPAPALEATERACRRPTRLRLGLSRLRRGERITRVKAFVGRRRATTKRRGRVVMVTIPPGTRARARVRVEARTNRGRKLSATRRVPRCLPG
jgi:sugar lactone lactonase YvrE